MGDVSTITKILKEKYPQLVFLNEEEISDTPFCSVWFEGEHKFSICSKAIRIAVSHIEFKKMDIEEIFYHDPEFFKKLNKLVESFM